MTAVARAIRFAIDHRRVRPPRGRRRTAPGWCYGDYCSGMNLHTTRHVPDGNLCDAGGVTVASTAIPSVPALLELRWSPNCKTNWARVPASFAPGAASFLSAVQCQTGYTQGRRIRHEQRLRVDGDDLLADAQRPRQWERQPGQNLDRLRVVGERG